MLFYESRKKRKWIMEKENMNQEKKIINDRGVECEGECQEEVLISLDQDET